MAHKEQIVEAAAKMFMMYGVKAVRMDDIAHELGVSKRTLYELFGDKEELLFQSMMNLYQLKREHHATITAKAENILEAMFMVLNEIMLEAPTQVRLTTNLKKFYPSVFERMKSEGIESNHRDLRKMIEEGIRLGFFLPDMNIDLTLSIFYSAAQAIRSNGERILIPKEMSERKAFMQVIRTLFRGISTPEGISLIDKYADRYNPDQKKEN